MAAVTTTSRGPRAARRTLGLAALLASAACGPAPEPRPRDVVLVTIDTLRADHLGIYGYERPTSPRLDAWFAEARVFERAYSAEARTAPSVASLLSGKHPQDHGVRLFYQLAPEGLELIPDRLPPAYQTAAFVSNIVLTDEAIGIADHFDHYDDFVSQRESRRAIFERDAELTSRAALTWMLTERDPSRPLFLWVHYIDPHGPYRVPEDWGVEFAAEGEREVPPGHVQRYIVEPGVTNGFEYVANYDEEITYVDEHVGRLLDGLAGLMALDESLVILTSDHGETMMEHERWFSHGYNVYEGITRVPLLVRAPGAAPARIAELASGIDVAPTILRFVGAEVPADWSGADLVTGEGLSGDRVVFTEAASKEQQWRAALHGERKVRIAVEGEREVSDETTYDLARDASETAGTPAPSDDPLVARLLELVAADPDPAGVPAVFTQGTKLDEAKVDPRVSDDDLEALRAMGYVGDDE